MLTPRSNGMRSKPRSWALVATAAVAVTLLVAACGGDGGSSSGGSDGGGGGGENTADAGTPTPGGKITYALEAETSSGWCLPEATLAVSGIQVACAIYDTLTIPD